MGLPAWRLGWGEQHPWILTWPQAKYLWLHMWERQGGGGGGDGKVGRDISKEERLIMSRGSSPESSLGPFLYNSVSMT